VVTPSCDASGNMAWAWGLGLGAWGLGFGVWGLGGAVVTPSCDASENRAEDIVEDDLGRL